MKYWLESMKRWRNLIVIFLLLSAIIHILTFFIFKHEEQSQTHETRPSRTPDSQVDFQVVNPVSSPQTEEKAVQSDLVKKEEPVKKPKHHIKKKNPVVKQESLEDTTGTDDAICDHWYGGVGIQIAGAWLADSIDSGVITNVFPGYSAERAGLRVDDEVLSTENSEGIRGEPGTSIRIFILRNHKTFWVTLIREKICYHRPVT